MKHIAPFVVSGLFVPALFLCLPARAEERWSREVGVVDYFAKYTYKAPDRSGKSVVKACFAAVKAVGLEPEWVDVDIFLPANKQEREKYKRIVIPSYANWFSKTLYEGMDDYVLSGGLLIANSSLILLDANDNYMVDAPDAITDFAKKRFLGVFGHGSCSITKLCVLHECPLTRGLPLGTWLSLPKGTAGRRTRNIGAYAVVKSNQIVKKRESEQPFLTFRHSGKGACIYLVGSIAADSGEHYARLVRNLFEEKVLEWLCLQE